MRRKSLSSGNSQILIGGNIHAILKVPFFAVYNLGKSSFHILVDSSGPRVAGLATRRDTPPSIVCCRASIWPILLRIAHVTFSDSLRSDPHIASTRWGRGLLFSTYPQKNKKPGQTRPLFLSMGEKIKSNRSGLLVGHPGTALAIPASDETVGSNSTSAILIVTGMARHRACETACVEPMSANLVAYPGSRTS